MADQQLASDQSSMLTRFLVRRLIEEDLLRKYSEVIVP